MRYRFVRDDDGHNYLIPSNEKNQFDRWVYDQSWDGKEFDDYRINGVSQWTFENPLEDE